MKRNTTHYAYGTSITQSYPFGIYVSAYALCPDGRVRKVKRIAQTADSFCTIPASIKYKGKTVAGHLYFSNDITSPAAVMFAPYSYRKHGKIFNSTEV